MQIVEGEGTQWLPDTNPSALVVGNYGDFEKSLPVIELRLQEFQPGSIIAKIISDICLFLSLMSCPFTQ